MRKTVGEGRGGGGSVGAAGGGTERNEGEERAWTRVEEGGRGMEERRDWTWLAGFRKREK